MVFAGKILKFFEGLRLWAGLGSPALCILLFVSENSPRKNCVAGARFYVEASRLASTWDLFEA
ncbi:hypothetical protein VC35_18765 [Pseudomonas fluorescens]|uniref:Uncharacterized protein n=1 Tax=Pseudomonas fluorescens TaxID=294 RepID=A0A0F4TIK2_PSEFL|nr:hypothetical protein VC35_18765 [Pseudomonas fluorescens]